MTLDFQPTEEPRPGSFAIAVYDWERTGLGVIADGIADEEEGRRQAASLSKEHSGYAFDVLYEIEPDDDERCFMTLQLLKRRTRPKVRKR